MVSLEDGDLPDWRQVLEELTIRRLGRGDEGAGAKIHPLKGEVPREVARHALAFRLP